MFGSSNPALTAEFKPLSDDFCSNDEPVVGESEDGAFGEPPDVTPDDPV